MLLRRSDLGGRGASAVALLSATTLSLIVVITQVAVEAQRDAGVLTVTLFPARGPRLVAIAPVTRAEVEDRESLQGIGGAARLRI